MGKEQPGDSQPLTTYEWGGEGMSGPWAEVRMV
jgi:hypothetical protein